MKITVIFTGKSEKGYITEGIKVYEKRVKHYIPFEIITLQGVGQMTDRNIRIRKEADMLLSRLSPEDHLILLDEKGEEMNSVQFSALINQSIQQRIRKLVFVIGGPFGFSEEVKKRAQSMLRLSAMTFSHQVVRIIFMEQLYRACTILRGEPYHHE